MRRRSDFPLYLAMRAAVAGVQALPRGAAFALGAALGRFTHAPLGLRRAVAEANLAIAFPERSEEERRAICRAMYAHWGRVAVGMVRASASAGREMTPVRDGAEEAAARVHDLLARGRGLLVLTGHLGDWEAAGLWLRALGIPVTTVWKPQANPYVAAYLDRLRVAVDIDAIPMPDARTGVTAALRAGRMVALLSDQAPVRSGVWVPFFGRPTKTFAGPGHFAAQTGAPVIFGVLLDDGAGGLRVHIETIDDAPDPDPAVEVPRIATRYRARLEALIRTAPEQYLWTHRLWKQQPPEGVA